MIWGAADVNAAALNQAKQAGSTLLGFNEPDNQNQSNMTVTQALSLWPQLMATGMTLGSPAVAANAATPGSWLSQFMKGATARRYPVNFIAVHWYGANFATSTAVSQLESYLQAIYALYRLPLWLTEFALVNWSTNTYPTESQQAPSPPPPHPCWRRYLMCSVTRGSRCRSTSPTATLACTTVARWPRRSAWRIVPSTQRERRAGKALKRLKRLPCPDAAATSPTSAFGLFALAAGRRPG